MTKRTRAAALLSLTAAGAGLAVAAAGCGGGPSPAASRPAGSHLPVSSASKSPGAGTSVTSRTSPAAHPATARATVPAAASPTATPSTPAHSRGGPTTLSWGIYVDARAGAPHYVLSVAQSGHSAIKGSVNYLYQGGATFVGQYTGTLSGSGRLTIRFGPGKVLAGFYRNGRLSLGSCTSVLPRATNRGGCTFTYNGNVPD
jgi:hypothetical protein